MSKRRATDAVCLRAFDFESQPSADGRTLEGYAAVFNTPARIHDALGHFDEVLLPGAFTRSLQTRKPVLQFEHGKDPRVGAVPIGSIQKLCEDERGLYVSARLFDNATVEPVRQAIAEGAITGMSFRFTIPEGGERWSTRDGGDYREISQTDTRELGPVVFPAYDAATVSVRSLLAHVDVTERAALVRELLRAERAMAYGAALDSDEDPQRLAAALDAIIDSALACDMADPAGVAQAFDLLTAAETASDALLAALGVTDPDDPSGRSNFTGDLVARSARRSDAAVTGGTRKEPTIQQRLDEGALRLRGVRL